MSEPWYKPHGVLDPIKHSRLISNRDFYARDAGIPQELLWKALPALTKAEKDWLGAMTASHSVIHTRTATGYTAWTEAELKVYGTPVERPVVPLSAMRRPRCSRSPSFTSTFDRCA